ncbi:hypothetical protein GGS23DRAFT_599416 [Durotheca rogersii]|uniref:uncharacterized protein n=1 Tax=Durotheca rogersii TaxID=419775 RepID=UPI0022203AE3|nr:uncharacterized protein GGS23DRAFT_599416 [Durotheca rogersii]KAI5860608.1 hypothetical protein GGS23DRAFT_599416 [Durotheca rogersii]
MPSSQGSPEPATWHEILLRNKYNNPMKLKDVLDKMYGKGKYRIRSKSSNLVLLLPEPLKEVPSLSICHFRDPLTLEQDQAAELERGIMHHYHGSQPEE